ncbi:hypothetical protein GS597_17340 [Synechococcales cyanobacterium C]|uniref:Uncharacterized protein n=1 Tax=Petrachloros mirabilis ULC683 TaxID=2781853 RepID=A0A8K2A8N6_9CYAN|nr:hypothetical protein [Petrachloros mirabilis]NCJ08239.1 hypothetical protein [Petrachloros mirabilis ULC683]
MPPASRHPRLAQRTNTPYPAQTPALIFRAKAGEPAVNFRLPLPQGALPPTSQATILQGSQIGTLSLQVDRDRIHSLDQYTWQLEPSSYAYLGRSGYKGVQLHYTYSAIDQPTSTLRLFCQTLDLRQDGEHRCRLSGSGPVLQGDLNTLGRLDLGTVGDALTPTLTTEQQRFYDRGFELGQRDRQINLSADYQRYRSEYTPTFAADFREGYATGYSNEQPRPQSPNDLGTGNRSIYVGRGNLLIYPASGQSREQRYALTGVEIRPETPDQTRLVWTVENQTQPVVMLGTSEPATSHPDRRIRLRAIDDIPAQGTLEIGSTGRIRTLERIFMGSSDQEVTLDFRPN